MIRWIGVRIGIRMGIGIGIGSSRIFPATGNADYSQGYMSVTVWVSGERVLILNMHDDITYRLSQPQP